MDLHYLRLTPAYQELMLLLAIHRRGAVPMPADPADLPASALEQVPLSRLLDDGLLQLAGGVESPSLQLTAAGQGHLRRLVIDYHLELLALRQTSDDFVAERVGALEAKQCRRIVLYGASDTARVLLEFLKPSSIQVVAVIDDDPQKQGGTLADVPIVGYSALTDLDFDSIVVTTVAFQDAILRDKVGAVPRGTRLLGLFDDFQR